TAPSLRVTVADALSKGAALSVGRVELAGSGAFADTRAATSRVDLADLRVVTEELTWPVRSPARVQVSARFRDRGELEAKGVARLTAPPPAAPPAGRGRRGRPGAGWGGLWVGPGGAPVAGGRRARRRRSGLPPFGLPGGEVTGPASRSGRLLLDAGLPGGGTRGVGGA